jgi:hypothetical protein
MSPPLESQEAAPEREPFVARWTGALAVGLFIYIPITLLLTFSEGTGGEAFEVFKLFSDFPASLGSAVLATVAALKASDPAVKRTWTFLAASIGVYTVGNFLNSAYWLYGVDPFPSVGDVFFLGFYPLLFTAIFVAIRAAAVRVQWGRLALDATILMLGFGAFFWFFVIAPAAAADRDPDVFKYVLSQSYIALNCLMLLAFGILLMHAGAGSIAPPPASSCAGSRRCGRSRPWSAGHSSRACPTSRCSCPSWCWCTSRAARCRARRPR